MFGQQTLNRFQTNTESATIRPVELEAVIGLKFCFINTHGVI